MNLQEDKVDPQIIFVKKDMSFEEWANLYFDSAAYDLENRTILYENDGYIVYGK